MIKLPLFILSLLWSSVVMAQERDSLQRANWQLDSICEALLTGADTSGTNVAIIRTYGTHNYSSELRVIMQRDSCSYNYILSIGEGYAIEHTTVTDVETRGGRPCKNKFPVLQQSVGDRFTNRKPVFDTFATSGFTLIGVIDGKYWYETFDDAFVTHHHPGGLHHILRTCFGMY